MDAIINFKTNGDVKKEAQKIAKKMGVSLSSVLNMLLFQFVRNKQLDIRLENLENFNEKTQKQLLKTQEEYDEGKMKTYSPAEAKSFLEELSNS